MCHTIKTGLILKYSFFIIIPLNQEVKETFCVSICDVVALNFAC